MSALHPVRQFNGVIANDGSGGRTGRAFREEPTTLGRMSLAEWAVRVQKQAFF
jgi:hypothetical protein